PGKLRMRGPKFGQRLARSSIAEIRRDVGQRLQYEGVFEFRPGNFQVSRALEHEVVEKHDIDVQRATGKTRHVATSAVRVLQCMQPGVQREYVEVAVDDGGGIQEFGTVETH